MRGVDGRETQRPAEAVPRKIWCCSTSSACETRPGSARTLSSRAATRSDPRLCARRRDRGQAPRPGRTRGYDRGVRARRRGSSSRCRTRSVTLAEVRTSRASASGSGPTWRRCAGAADQPDPRGRPPSSTVVGADNHAHGGSRQHRPALRASIADAGHLARRRSSSNAVQQVQRELRNSAASAALICERIVEGVDLRRQTAAAKPPHQLQGRTGTLPPLRT